MILFKFHKHVVQTSFKECMERLTMSALSTVVRKNFNGKFITKIDFPIGHLMLPLMMLTLEV